MNNDTLTVLHAALSALNWARDGYGIHSKLVDEAINELQTEILTREVDPDFFVPD